jgi:hypothetical protein
MQRVKELYEELGAPGQQKLWLEVRKRKIQATRSQVDAFVSKQGERQVYTQPLPQARGQTAAEDVNARYMLDVVFIRDLIVVFLVNVFTRKTWGKTVPNKSAASVGAAGKVLIDSLEEQPKVLSTDDGKEYAELATYLKEKGIGHKVSVSDRDVNALAVLDRAVQDVKQRFTRMMARTGAGDEKVKLDRALTAHNNAHISTIHGAPNEVGKSQDIQFLNLVDNAAKFEHNTKILGERTIALEKTGAFRKPRGGVTKNAFRRGFDAKWGDVENVARIEGSQVVGEKGTRVDIKLVQAVDASSSQPANIERETARTEKKKEALFDLMDTLLDWLGGGEKSLRAAAMHLARTRFDLGGRQVLYKELLRSQGFTKFGALADAIRLFPQMLKLTRGGFYFRAN